MNPERTFTQKELEEMGTRTVDLIERAINSGDRETAKKLSQRMYKETLAGHDFYRDWVTALLTFIGKQYGDDVLHKALEESFGPLLEPMLDMYEEADIRQRVQLFAATLRAHYQPVEISEDEEKFIFRTKPCGTGGRLVLEGKYGPPRNYLKVKKPQAMTYWKEDFPVYCCHGYFVASIPVAKGRVPAFFEIPSNEIGKESCEFWLYKDPNTIPPEAYAKAGVEVDTGEGLTP